LGEFLAAGDPPIYLAFVVGGLRLVRKALALAIHHGGAGTAHAAA
jgi:hypothetical protein